MRRIAFEKGVFLRHEAIALGYDDRTFRNDVRAGIWVRVRHGAYVPKEVWDAADECARFHLRGRAVMRSHEPRVALSHQSAVAAFGGDLWEVDLSRVHVTRRGTGFGRVEHDVVHHVGVLEDDEVVEANGVVATTPARAVLELCSVSSLAAGMVAVESLATDGVLTLEQLRTQHERMERWPGMRRAQLLIRLATGRMQSVAEVRFYLWCWEMALPCPVPQYEIKTRAGTFSVDFAWPELGVIVEVDGLGKYRTPYDAELSAADVVIREKRREDAIREATGWIVLRVTWADLARPQQLLERLRAAMAPGRRTTARARS